MESKRLKKFFKLSLKLTGINFIAVKLLNYVIDSLLSRDPYLYRKIQKVYEQQYIQDLKNSFLHVGSSLNIDERVKVDKPHNVSLGNNVHIGEDCFFVATGGIIINDHCHLSRNVTIYSANHEYMGNAIPYDDKFVCAPVILGRGVWIGRNVNILPGVKIGNGAIIGMGTTVSKDVGDYEIVISSQQRSVKTRDEDKFKYLYKRKKFGDKDGFVLSNSQIQMFTQKLTNEGRQITFVACSDEALQKEFSALLKRNYDIEVSVSPKPYLYQMLEKHGEAIEDREEARRVLKEVFCELPTGTSKIYVEVAPYLDIAFNALSHMFLNLRLITISKGECGGLEVCYSRSIEEKTNVVVNNISQELKNMYKFISSDKEV